MKLIIEKGTLHGKKGWIAQNNDIDFKTLLLNNNYKFETAQERMKEFIMERLEEIQLLKELDTITLSRNASDEYFVNELVTLLPSKYGRKKQNIIRYNESKKEFRFIWNYVNVDSELVFMADDIYDAKPLILDEIKKIANNAEYILIKNKMLFFK